MKTLLLWIFQVNHLSCECHCYFDHSVHKTVRPNGSSKWTLCNPKQTKKKVSELLAFYITRLQSTSTAQHPAPYPKPYATITTYSDFSPVLLSTCYTSTKTYKTTFSQDFLASLSPFKGGTNFKAPSQERNLEGKFTIKNCIDTNCFIQRWIFSVYEYFILMHIYADKSHKLKWIVLTVHP